MAQKGEPVDLAIEGLFNVYLYIQYIALFLFFFCSSFSCFFFFARTCLKGNPKRPRLLGRKNEQSKMPTMLGITSDCVCVPYFLAATLWKSDAFQFPVFIESSPPKKQNARVQTKRLRNQNEK
jgi:hypothetical protein